MRACILQRLRAFKTEIEMQRKTSVVAGIFALCAGLLAACDKAPERDANRGAQPSRAETPQPPASSPTTPANIGQPKSLEEKKEGANPVQGQVDPKAPEQHRDFKQSGDAAGPTSPETKPRGG
jgi:hypothetical protein